MSDNKDKVINLKMYKLNKDIENFESLREEVREMREKTFMETYLKRKEREEQERKKRNRQVAQEYKLRKKKDD